MVKIVSILIFLSLAISLSFMLQHDTKNAEVLPYFDVSLALDERVSDLLSRMTLEEKVSQLSETAVEIPRLSVPAYNWWNEALHGVARAGKATVFPQAIGMAAMFDEALMHSIATVISDEGRAKHHYYARHDVRARYTGLTFWSPNINIFRDPRWGRGQETYGEDPYLTGRLAVNFIRGLQGDHPSYLKTAATAKHFAVHSGPEKSRHSDDYQSSVKDLYETYLPAFKAAVVDAEVESVMCAYNRVDGTPACGSDALLGDILRGQYQFKGHVMSDCGALEDFHNEVGHKVAETVEQAAAWALQAGTDLNCGFKSRRVFPHLKHTLEMGLIKESDIDTALTRLFKTRFKLGMFDPIDLVPFAKTPMTVVGSQKHLALSQQAAEQSLVLLKNDGVLPLAQGTKVALIGPNVNNIDVLLGNYHGSPIRPITPLQGVLDVVGQDRVSYSPGSSIVGSIYGHYKAIGKEHFFHVNSEGGLEPGLEASYFAAKSGVDVPALKVIPEFTRIDKNIDFYWQRSPLDDAVHGEFGVEWSGILVPNVTGIYQFQTEAIVSIADEEITETVELIAGQRYQIKVTRSFLTKSWGNQIEPSVILSWVNTSENLTEQALTAAGKADVIIFMGGISPKIEGEEMEVVLEGFDGGDRTHLRLPQAQALLLKALKALNKPIVVVNFSGGAVALNWAHANTNAIIQSFYPGEATGVALAKLIWGGYSPSGRLPITFYQSLEGMPDFNDYSMKNRTYKYFEGEVLYPFGHGLSYTSFLYSELSVAPTLEQGQDLKFSIELNNTGAVDSGQVTQVYASLLDAPVRVPIRELKAFKRSFVKAGAKTTLAFSIKAADLKYVGEDGLTKNYSGRLRLSVGAGQESQQGQAHVLTALLDVL